MVSSSHENKGIGSALSRRQPASKLVMAWMVLGLVCAAALSFYKGRLLESFAQKSLGVLESRHSSVLSAFQAGFYFFYEDQFVPGIREQREKTPHLDRIQILTQPGVLIFDSAVAPESQGPQQGQADAKTFDRADVVAGISGTKPSVFFSGFRVQILMPSGYSSGKFSGSSSAANPSEQYGVLYTFDGSDVRNTLVLTFLLFQVFVGLGLAYSNRKVEPGEASLSVWPVLAQRVLGLRGKFMATIVLINLVTGAIVYFTLTALQTRDQTQRIRKESFLFAQFSTPKMVSDFTKYFYFNYQEKFLPGIRGVIASNENLVAIRIISKRTRAVLFDSEQNAMATTPPEPLEMEGVSKFQLTQDLDDDLEARNFLQRELLRNGEELLSIVHGGPSENQDSLFWVEYVFSYYSLKTSLAEIRRQILVDLLPAMALGLLIAAIFAQLLIQPIRKLVQALQRVATGDYDVSVRASSSDELGELSGAFNTMTGELKKKSELRKYLSDSTYRKVMQSAQSSGGAASGGVRVAATVLFSDIRGFVSHCENLEAEEVTAMLNEYFGIMVEVVHRNGGEVDKFIGDALLAVFYPQDNSRHSIGASQEKDQKAVSTALQAIFCGLEMREKLAELNQKRKDKNKSPIEIGVGITHGEVISGPIGARDRMDFTVIGDVVNLANRIEKVSKLGRHTRVVFSHQVEPMVRGILDYEFISDDAIRGKEEAVTVFELIQVRDVQALAANLKKDHPEERRRTVEVLGQSRNPAALPYALDALEDRDEAVRVEACVAVTRLSSVDHPVTLDALFRSLKNEKSQRAISAQIGAIGKLCTTDRILGLETFLESEHDRVVANAVEAIGRVKDPRCTDLLVSKLASKNNRVKANAAMCLFAAGHLEVIDVLKPMLMHSDPLMRASAAFAIGELTLLAEKERLIEEWRTRAPAIKSFLGDLQECVPMLVGLLRDPEAAVKRQAVIALGKIKDRSAVLSIIDTVDLERDSKEMIRDISEALRSIGSHKLVREVISRLK